MALDKTVLKTALKNALIDVDSKNNKDGVGKETALKNLADALGEVVDWYIKMATVTTVVTGTSATGGAVTGTGTGNLS